MVQPHTQAIYYKQPGYEARDGLALIDYIDIRVYYCRYGNFCAIKFSCFNISCKNTFVVSDTHEKTTHAKKM